MHQTIMEGADLSAILQDPEITARIRKVTDFLEKNGIDYEMYRHPPLPTIEIALEYWKSLSAVHCKNLFMRNHKGNRHYLVCFNCDHDLDIHYLEHRLKESLISQGLPSCGKLSFASPERMMRYLGLEPGSVSPFGLINDTENHVHLFLDDELSDATTLSFHPNDCRGTVVIKREDFERYLSIVGNTYEYLKL